MRCPHKRLRLTFVHILSWIRRLPQAAIRALVSTQSSFLQTFLCNLQNQHPSRAIGLRDSQWGKATKLDRFQGVFAFSLNTEQCRSILDRSHTTSWSDAGWIDPKSISEKCYIPRLSLNWTGTAIGWFLVTWPWLKSNVSRSWNINMIKQCAPLGLHYSTWSKHGGKWRDRRREKHCQFFFYVNEYNLRSGPILAVLIHSLQWLPLKLVFVSPCPPECYFQSETKIEPDLIGLEWTQQHKHEASSWKATLFKVIPGEKQQLVEEKDADNIRTVLCKSFIK